MNNAMNIIKQTTRNCTTSIVRETDTLALLKIGFLFLSAAKISSKAINEA